MHWHICFTFPDGAREWNWQLKISRISNICVPVLSCAISLKTVNMASFIKIISPICKTVIWTVKTRHPKVWKNSQTPTQKNLNTVFRRLYNYKTDNNKRMLCLTRQRKRASDIIQKCDKMNEILSESDCLSTELQFLSLCTT